MLRRSALLLLASLPLGAVAAPVPPEDDVARMRRIYGTKANFRDDCGCEMPGQRFRISIPPARFPLHHLTQFHPRVGKEVRGDFTAVVRVEFPIRPARPDAFDTQTLIGYGGLVGWSESGESAYVLREETHYEGAVRETFTAGHEHPAGGRGGSHLGGPKGRPDTADLRLTREGRTVSMAYSRDGKEWDPLGGYEVGWGGAVRVGVMAENGFGSMFEATFDRYSLTQPKK